MILNKDKFSVIGSGNWGRALASILQNNKKDVLIWTHNDLDIQDNKFNFSTDFNQVLLHSQNIVIAVASKFYRSIIERLKPLLSENAVILSATKGLELGTEKLMSEILTDTLSINWLEKAAFISGPNLAKEILVKKPAACVVASKNLKTALFFQEMLSLDYFRAYTSSDIIGIELGGSLKNIFAIAAGISDGLEFGTNAKSALMVRCLPEMIRFGMAMGADLNSFYGLSGLGDLITTCSSPLSRNYQVGLALAKGQNIQSIEKNMSEVAEGVNTTKSVYIKAKKLNIEIPITEKVYSILFQNCDPYQAFLKLMNRTLKAEDVF